MATCCVDTKSEKLGVEMTLICTLCGNKEKFIKIANYAETAHEEHFCDGEGNVYDYGHSETDNSEFTDYDDEVTCMKCNHECREGQEIKDLEGYELAELRANHTDKRGAWHKEPLKTPNQQILMQAAAETI